MTYLSLFARLRLLAAAITPLLVFAPSGCDSNVDAKIAQTELGDSCLVNSDCTAPTVCAFKACHAECVSSRDCDDGARCVAASRPYKVCQLEQERQCERTADCAEGLVCGIDGECRDQCQTDGQCVEDQKCVSGTCADANELDDDGQLTPAKGTTRGAEGSPCVYVSDCSEALLCRSQACAPECKADKDCPLHQTCMLARCVPDGSQPSSCDYNSDCDAEHGKRCLGGSCLCQCVEDRDCPAGDVCNGCGCEADPNAAKACVYNSDCEKPGEICQNSACACACKTDADCGGLSCDGCGCVEKTNFVDGVVQGSVFIDSTLQLSLYRGVREIHGQLNISGGSIKDLGDTFAELELIDGPLSVTDAKQLEALELPKLAHVDSIQISNLSLVDKLDLPLLKSSGINISSMPSLKALNLAGLDNGQLQLSSLPKLTVLDLSLVTTLNQLVLADVSALTELSLPELTQIKDSLQITGYSPLALSKLSAPKLTTLVTIAGNGSVTFDHTKLTTLTDFGAKNQLGERTLKVHAGSVQISNNQLISYCEVDAFLSLCPDRIFTVSQDFIVCNQCDGTTCKD